jgi:uncharacterized protein (TIGR03435 family)
VLTPLPGGRFTARNVTLRQLVAFAFGISNSRSDMLVTGGESWLDADRFDVEAAAGVDLARGQTGPLVRALLEERFLLRARLETRDRPIYHLVLDRADGRLGPGFQASTASCAASGGAPNGGTSRCGLLEGPGSISGLGATAADFANAVAPFAGRVVVDRTGLQGPFNIQLKWTPDQPRTGPNDARPSTEIPGLFTAVKEQLGLKLDDARGPVEVVVIESVSRLRPN